MILVEAVRGNDPDCNRLNHRFDQLEQDDSGVTVHFSNGSSYRSTGVVGCDGGASRVRSVVFGDQDAAYTGQTEQAERLQAERDLLDNKVKALVATSALGMGFDKPDLGFIVHVGAPQSPVAYYQQIGRAGRGVERAEVILLPGTEDRDIWAYYRHADFCMVTSLHDGMNLVAKEFVSVRDDEDGALILSRFAGASHELRDALIVNPYDLAGMAESIRAALEMPPEERRARMIRMRHSVVDHNIYRWAGLLLSELARIPVETTGAKAS